MAALPATRAQPPVDRVPAQLADRLGNGQHPSLPKQQFREHVLRPHGVRMSGAAAADRLRAMCRAAVVGRCWG